MGASGSKIKKDKALQLCCERKELVQQAIDATSSLAAAHVTYLESLKNSGSALRKFFELEPVVESSLHTFINATPAPLRLTEKSLSQLSVSSPSILQVDATETFSPSRTPGSICFSSIRVEERPSEAAITIVTCSNTSQNTTLCSTETPESLLSEAPSLPPRAEPRDYLGLFHPIDQQFSFQEGKELNQGFEKPDDVRQLREQEGIPELEDKGKASFEEREGSQGSDDEFDEPPTHTIIQGFENSRRMHDLNGPTDSKKRHVEEDSAGSKVAPKDFLSSMKEIESLFIKASDCGKEVQKMLEANKFHFCPIFLGKQSGSRASMFSKASFSCGEGPSQVKEGPPDTAVSYMTWHRTSARSSSFGNTLGLNTRDEDVEDLTDSAFNNICMVPGNHASTLDRLYAWESKLYDEVKASKAVRREYDLKYKYLYQLESQETRYRPKKDRFLTIFKYVHSRYRISIHKIHLISERIVDLRDKELQRELEELIKRLSRMWEVMLECHKHQSEIISIAFSNGNMKISLHSKLHRQITAHLIKELSSLCSSFTNWIGAQEGYLQCINNWLFKCICYTQQSSKRKSYNGSPPVRNFGPPIYALVGVWLDKLQILTTSEVSGSIQSLAAEISRFLPREVKNQGKNTSHSDSTPWKGDSNSCSGVNLLRDDVLDVWNSGFDLCRNSLIKFLGRLNEFAEASVGIYVELEKAIPNPKNRYNEISARDPKGIEQHV